MTTSSVEAKAVDNRVSNVKLAIVTSLFSRLLSAGVQLIAYPIAVRALGVEKFAIYAMLAASLSWLSMAGFGVGPGLMNGIAKSVVNGDREEERRYFSTAILSDFFIAVAIIIVAFSILLTIQPHVIFGNQYAKYDGETRTGLLVLVCYAAISIVVYTAETAQVAYKEQFLINTSTIIGNTLSFWALLYTSFKSPSITGMIISVFIVPMVCRALNALHLILVRRPYLKPSIKFWLMEKVRVLFSVGLSFTLIQASNFFGNQIGIVSVGRVCGAAEAARYAILIQIINLSTSVLSIVSQPMWPMFMEAFAIKDVSWFLKAKKKLLIYYMLAASAIGFVIFAFGGCAIKIVFSPHLIPGTYVRFFVSLYFILSSWEAIHYLLLTSMESYWNSSVTIFCRSIFSFLLSLVFLKSLGAEWLAFSLVITTLFSSTWLMPVLTQRRIKAILYKN